MKLSFDDFFHHLVCFVLGIILIIFGCGFYGLNEPKTINFTHAGGNYVLYYEILRTQNSFELGTDTKINGRLTVFFNDKPIRKNSIAMQYDSSFPGKIDIGYYTPGWDTETLKEAGGIFLKWHIQKSKQEIKEIMTTALFAVIEKEYPNILVDPETKDLKFKL